METLLYFLILIIYAAQIEANSMVPLDSIADPDFTVIGHSGNRFYTY